MEYCESRESELHSLVFFPLFASWFLLQLFTVGQPHIRSVLLLLSSVGILGITWSLRREKKRAWLYAVPSVVVMLLLIGTDCARAAAGNTIHRGDILWSLADSYLATALYLSLPLAVAVLLVGLLLSGMEHAGPLAIVAGLLGALALPSIVQDPAKMGDALRRTPIRSSDDPVLLLYMLLVMPIVGVLVLLAG